MVKPKHHLARYVDEDRIAAAIRVAEAHTTGKVVVVLSSPSRGDIIAAAAQAFAKLDMHRSHHRNSVLLFVAPSKREFAVVGDARDSSKTRTKLLGPTCSFNEPEDQNRRS